MSDIVEELLFKYGLLDRPKKPKIIDGEPMPRYRWRLLRDSIKNVADQVSRDDSHEKHISHGIEHLRKLSTKPVNQVIYIHSCNEYLTLDEDNITFYHGDGRFKEEKPNTRHFNRLTYAEKVDQFVSWRPGFTSLTIFSNNFEEINESKTSSGIDTVIYNEETGDIISCEPGTIIQWVFRFGNRHLLPKRRVLYDDLSPHRPGDIPETPKEVHHLNLVVLESTASKHQRLFGVFGKSIKVFSLFQERCIATKREMHSREITAITYFNPLKYLITGSLDGSIKGWDDNFRVMMVFVGHNALVSSLSIYPFGPAVMSTSHDRTIRVWNLEVKDEVDYYEMESTPQQLGSTLNREIFHTVNEDGVDLWRGNQLHSLHTKVLSTIIRIKTVLHPYHPTRAMLIAQDHNIHVVSPTTGQPITSIANPFKPRLIDASYARDANLIFCLYKNGSIRKFSAATNPCERLNDWSCEDRDRKIALIDTYEYIIDKDASSSRIMSRSRGSASSRILSGVTLLIGARYDGHLCVIDIKDGTMKYSIEAHGTRPILCLESNVKNDQIISAGEDNVIKVWRVYPFSEEPFTPLMSFFCNNMPLQLTVCKKNLIVGFEDPNTANFTSVLYNIESKARYDHSPNCDHNDSFSGVASCPRLKLFVTASVDCTLRVWDEKNRLIRALHLHLVPWSVAFANEKGDILVGLGQDLYIIDHRKYLPQKYLMKMVMMVFDQPIKDEPLPKDDHLMKELSLEDVRKLNVLRPAFHFDQYTDYLSPEESKEVQAEKEHKEKVFKLLEKRDEELRKIRDGELKPAPKPKLTKATEARAFNNFLKLFYDNPKIPIPTDIIRKQDEENEMPKIKVDEKFIPEQNKGFFPPISKARYGDDFITPVGYIPNSVLIKLIWPPDVIQEQIDTWKPPEISEEELSLLQEVEANILTHLDSKDEDSDSVRMFDWEDSDKEDDRDLFSGKQSKKSSPSKSSFMSKLQDVLDKPPSPPPVEPLISSRKGFAVDDPTPSSTPPVETPTRRASQSSSMKKKMMMKEAAKIKESLSARKKTPPPPPPPKEPTPPPPPEPSPPREPTPPPVRQPPPPKVTIPDYILRFKEELWYKQNELNNPSKLPDPLTVSSWCNLISSFLLMSNWEDRCRLCDAITNLCTTEKLSNNTINVCKRQILHLLEENIDIKKNEQRKFLLSALNTLVALGVKDSDVVAEFVMWQLEGDEEIKTFTMNGLAFLGKNDPKSFLNKEIDTWDLLGVPESNRRKELKAIIESWLVKWLTKFKIHLKDTIDRLRKGEQITGKLSKLSSEGSRNARTSTQNNTRNSKMRPVPGSEQATNDLQQLSKVLTVTFDTVPDLNIVENANMIDAINYFCEMMLQDSVKKLKKKTKRKPVVDGPKNTVLVLPHLPVERQSLVRLGESHTDAMRKPREPSEIVSINDYTQPAAMQPLRAYQQAVGGRFAPFLHLSLKPCFVNPYLNEADIQEWEAVQPMMITLKCSQKYFIPALSCPPHSF